MILLGASSLDIAQAQRSGPKGYAHQWELKSITPGCIAMATVVMSHFFYPFYHFPRLTVLLRHSLSFHQTVCLLRRVQSPELTTTAVSNNTRKSSSKTSILHRWRHWWHGSTLSSSKSIQKTTKQFPLWVNREKVRMKTSSLVPSKSRLL